jgi:multidrug efflux system membrane fusion protein
MALIKMLGCLFKRPTGRFPVIALTLVLGGCGAAESVPEPVRPAIVAQPVPAAAKDAAFFSGDIRARHESQLGFRVGGKIERRMVDVGARVAAGDVLAVLDPADLRLELAASESAIVASQADASLAQAEFDRASALLERKLISTSQFESQQTALASARARLEQARAQQAVSRNQVGYAKLTADRAGVVTSITAETGQVVAPGQVVAILAQDGEPEVEIALPEAQVARYPVGTRAQVSVWSAPDRTFDGVVREVAPDADSASRTYRARVNLLQPDPAVQLGMTARVRFDGVADANLLSIPLTALHVRDETPAVWTVDAGSGQVSLTPVQVAAYREDAVEIASGLTMDDWLVVVGVHKLHDGQTVRPIGRDNRPIAMR